MKEKLYRINKKIFVLPLWLTVLIAVPSFLALIGYFLFFKQYELPGIPIYCLSAYALVIVCTGSWRVIKAFKKELKKMVLWNIFISDARFRTTITVIPGLLFNILYVVVNISLGVINHAMWFAYLGAYYLYLALMKGYLLQNLVTEREKVDYRKEIKKYRNCGFTLLLLNFVLVGESIYIVHKNQNYHYQGMLIYVMAAFAFYSLTMAIINLVKFRKFKSPVLSAIKVINLTTAMVTMIALETAMISQFGGDDNQFFRQYMTSATTGIVCFIEFVMAIYMIYRANQELKILEQKESGVK